MKKISKKYKKRKDKIKMMNSKKIFCSLIAVAMLLGVVYAVGAQPKEPYPLGEVTLESTQIAAGVGVTWGDGTLKFGGKEYKFTVRGLDAGAVGISKISAKGVVINLKATQTGLQLSLGGQGVSIAMK